MRTPRQAESDRHFWRVCVCARLFPRRFLFRVFGRMIRTAYATGWLADCPCLCVKFTFGATAMIIACSHIRVRVWRVFVFVCTRIQKRLREKWSDAQSKNAVARNQYKEPPSNQQKIHSVTNPVFEQLSKQNELLYSGKLRVLYFLRFYRQMDYTEKQSKIKTVKKNSKNQWKEQRTIVDR